MIILMKSIVVYICVAILRLYAAKRNDQHNQIPQITEANLPSKKDFTNSLICYDCYDKDKSLISYKQDKSLISYDKDICSDAGDNVGDKFVCGDEKSNELYKLPPKIDPSEEAPNSSDDDDDEMSPDDAIYPYIYKDNKSTPNKKISLFVNNFIKNLPNKPYFKDICRATSSKTSRYHHYVFDLLDREKKKIHDEESLVSLQKKIENMTMQYEILNEKSDMYKNYPNLIKLFIDDKLQTAKEYVKNKGELSSEDLLYINKFDEYTLEGIMIFVLANLFQSIDSKIPAVRVATLIDQIDTHVRFHGNIRKEYNSKEKMNEPANNEPANNESANNESEPANKDPTKRVVSRYQMRRAKKAAIESAAIESAVNESARNEPAENDLAKNEPANNPVNSTGCNNKVLTKIEQAALRKDEKAKERFKKKVAKWTFGVLLVHFLEDRELIKISKDLSPGVTTSKNKGHWYLELNHFAYCNFDINNLPIKLNLPMVCKPKPWQSIKESPKSLADLRGGYLDMPTGDFYSHNRFKLLSSRDIPHFHIELLNSEVMCKTMNILQSEPFEINSDVLDFILNNRDSLVNKGLLLPQYLKSLDIKKVTDKLRECYLEDCIHKVCKYNDILNMFLKCIQRSRYELFIIDMASAYNGYKFYLPAFLDFRGRIYRSGVLHFHERDLARSLIVFSNIYNRRDLINRRITDTHTLLKTAAAYHFKNFDSYEKAYKWYDDNIKKINEEDVDLINLALEAKHQYQFISKVITIENNHYNKINIQQLPITQDASASAYQIMSYFLLDEELAMQTNLISYDNDNDKIQDIYSNCLDELKTYLPKHLKSEIWICDIVLNENSSYPLTRTLIKSILMPLIYGKTNISIANDLYTHYKTVLNKGECFTLAVSIVEYFNIKFPGIRNLMNLLRNIGWLCSALGKPVCYQVPSYKTVQDYVKSKPVKIWLYDSVLKKKRQVTLRIPTNERDRRKSDVSTFVNFIHQKDAYIAMYMINNMYYNGAPIYTVHDNFITNVNYMGYPPLFYIKYFENHNPLVFINEFLKYNLNIRLNIRPYIIQPIPTNVLTDNLYKLIPKTLSSSERAIWIKRIDNIIKSYEYYIENSYKGLKPSIKLAEYNKLYENRWGVFCLHL